jgi:hypothetical protein
LAKPDDSPLNSGYSLLLSFPTLPPLSTARVPRSVKSFAVSDRSNLVGSSALCERLCSLEFLADACCVDFMLAAVYSLSDW